MSSSIFVFSAPRLRLATDRHQGMMDFRPESRVRFRARRLSRKGPEWRASSAASLTRFLDWYGLRALTGTSISSTNAGANTPALALTKPVARAGRLRSPGSGLKLCSPVKSNCSKWWRAAIRCRKYSKRSVSLWKARPAGVTAASCWSIRAARVSNTEPHRAFRPASSLPLLANP